MICLTGDIHHQSLNTGNQQHCEHTEVRTAQLYLELLRDAGVKVTFFISGKAFAEQWDELRPICSEPLVELGGHTWSCFEPALWHRFWNKALGSYNGPAWYQRLDVQRTIRIIRRKAGRTIRSWRNHMYMHGPFTDRILAEQGIRVCSDQVVAGAAGPAWNAAGILDVPINIIPDHEHLYHAERTPAWVEAWRRRYRWSDAFGSDSYHIDQWTEIVLEQLHEREERGELSTLIIHPITMYLCDRFGGFRRILDFLADRETVHFSDVLARAEREQGVGRRMPDEA